MIPTIRNLGPRSLVPLTLTMKPLEVLALDVVRLDLILGLVKSPSFQCVVTYANRETRRITLTAYSEATPKGIR